MITTQTDGLRGKHFFIAGATGGVGSLLAKSLVAAGANVFLAARDEAKLNALKTELDVSAATIDGADFESYDRAIEAAVSVAPLHGAVCCTGSLILKSAHATTQKEFESTIAANATSAFGLTRAAAKAMMDTGGSIILVASAAAQIGLQNHEAIATAKGAIMGLTLSAAATYSRNKIRVNCVSPGLTETPLTSRLFASDASRKASESMHPIGRLGRPEDIVSAMLWLLSDSSSWVTGQVIGVDGGLGRLKVRI
jgi:3-oxoacyl-[acyl-carrier protein] reductase